MAVILVRVLIVLIIFGCFIWISYKRKLNGKPAFSCAAVGILVGISAIFAWYLTDLIPFPTEEVRITALGEKNEAAKNDELYLTGIYVDGEQVELKTATDEHWFWQGDWYVWRNDSDTRRPKELSDSFVLKIPAGNERYIEFFKNMYKGFVRIEYQQESQIVDCYSEEGGRITSQISASNEFFIPLYYCVSFVSFIAIIILFILICNIFLQLSARRYNCLVKYAVIYQNIIIYIGLAIIMQGIMVYYHQFNPMVWVDDWINLCVVNESSLHDALLWNLEQNDLTPPLFNIIAFFWIRFVPKSLNAIFLLPQLFLVVSVVIMGLCGEELFDKRSGILCAAITAFSATLILSFGYEFRSYSMYFMFTTISFLFFIKSIGSKRNKRIEIYLTLSYMGLLYSHYYAIMAVGLFFLADAFYCYQKDKEILAIFKRNSSRLLMYIISLSSFTPWVLGVLFFQYNKTGDTIRPPWRGTPDISEITNTIEYYVSHYGILEILLYFGVAFLIYEIINRKRASKLENEYIIGILSTAMMTIPLAVIYLLSQYYPAFSSRYFAFGIPAATLLIVFAVNRFWKYVDKISLVQILSAVFMVLLVQNMHTTLIATLKKGTPVIMEQNAQTSQNYIQVVDSLLSMEDINYQSTSVCVVRQSGAGGGQRAFEFFLETDKTKGINVISNGEMEKYDDYDVLYMITYHNKKTFDTIVKKDSTLNENFTYDKSYCNGAIHRYVRKT